MTDAFTVNEFVEPKTGTSHRVYTYKRKPCHRVLLTSRLSTHLAGYSLIEKDLRSVLAWIDAIDKLHVERFTGKGNHFSKSADRSNYNVVKGLFVAALTFYGKCFSKCEGRPVKLERAQVASQFHDLHDQCIEYRHNFAAHSGSKRIESAAIALVYPKRFKREVPFKLFREINQPDLFWPAPADLSLAQLVTHVQGIALSKIESLGGRIEAEEVTSNAARFWPVSAG